VHDLRLREHGYRPIQLDPGYFSPYPDGRRLIQWRSVERMQAEIAAFSHRDAERYPAWVAFWRRVGGLLGRFTLAEPPSVHELEADARGTEDEEVVSRLLDWSVRRLLDEYFESPEVQAALVPNSDIHSLDEPGEVLGWAMTAPNPGARAEDQGLPRGGMGNLSAALLASAHASGVEVRLETAVQRILQEDGRTIGVELSNGSAVASGTVISNADPKRTFGSLLAPGDVPAGVREGVQSLDTESGSLKFHAAVSELPDFSAHLGVGHDMRILGLQRICPSLEYVERSLADANDGRATDHPILIVMIPTVYDPSVAPPGRHLVSIRVKFEPSHLREGSWDGIRQQLGERVIDALTEYAPNFRGSILDWIVHTPDDLERRVGLTDGNIHHINHGANQALGDRLFPGGGHRTPIGGLYLCGAGTHPGGEVTGAPGYNAARAVLADVAATAGADPR
jgi:phytoene dehydrogenase-like protein